MKIVLGRMLVVGITVAMILNFLAQAQSFFEKMRYVEGILYLLIPTTIAGYLGAFVLGCTKKKTATK